MKHKSGKIAGLVLAVMLCMVLLPTMTFATTYIDSDVTVSDWIYTLNDDMVINEGATLTFPSTSVEFSIAEYTLTNYGTIDGSYVDFVANSGVFYNYGVYQFKAINSMVIYDLTLRSIALSSGTLSPSFAAGTREYAVTVDNSVTSIDITPTLNNANDYVSLTVNGEAATSGTAATVSLNVGENTIPIVITADDGNNTTNTYTLTVTRSACTHTSYDANGFCEACGAYQPATKNGSTYEISNAGQLFWFAAYVNGDTTHADFTYTIWNKSANAVLTADIAIPTGYTWTPIGNYSSKTSLTYAGTFDGDGHTISGLSISTTSKYQGLFGYIAAGGTVKDVTVSGSIAGGDYTGGVAGSNRGTISGCTNSCAVSGGSNVGGVAGYNTATISGCTNAGTVTASDKYVGGLTGYNSGTVSSCANSGAVTAASSSYVGGIIGRDIGTVTGCTNSGTISGASYVGGISGHKNQGSIYGCINSGTISGTSYVGGIAGYNSGGIKASANTGAISGTSNVGGVVGQNKRGSIASCYSTDTSCGIAGSNSSTMTNCYYLTTSASAGGNSDALTAAQFASGEAAYLLNGSSSQASDLIWYQTIGTDSYPVLSSTHGIVYKGTSCINTAVYSNTVLSEEVHTLTYSASGNTITESCVNGCGHSATTTLTAPGNLVYDGSSKAANVSCDTGWKGDTPTVNYLDSYGAAVDADSVVNAGTYTAQITVGGVIAKVSFTVSKAELSVTAPEAQTLTYTGSTQNLVSAGSTSNGTMYYSLDKNDWSTEVPTGTNAGVYSVFYKVVGDENYNDYTLADPINVTISMADSSVTTAPTANTLTYTGAEQVLIEAGTATGGTMYYSLDNSDWSADIPTGINAETYTVYYKVVGDSNHDDYTPVNNSVSVTIEKADQSISYSAGSVAKHINDAAFINELTKATVDGGITYASNDTGVATVDEDGKVTIVGAGTATITATAAATENYNEATASYALTVTDHSYTVTTVDSTYTEQGYTLHTCDICGDSYQTDATAILVLDGTDSNVSIQTTVQALTELPDGLKNLYSSVDALIADLISRVTVGTGYTADNALVYDVVLQYSTDGGITWITATADNFPATGITVTIPYPEGTDSSYEFVVEHMFTVTSERLGITAGDTERPTVTKTDDGLVVTLTGLSPVAVSWKAVTTSATETETTDTSSQTDNTTDNTNTDTSGTSVASTVSSQTGDNSSVALWLALLSVSGAGVIGAAAYNRKRKYNR